MTREWKLRGMPARYLVSAPAVVRVNVLDIIAIKPAAPLDFDIVLREPVKDQNGSILEYVGLDFGAYGAQGCHFFLKRHEMRAYRERNRRKRIAWHDLPAPTQSAIVTYLESGE